jgi:hypothetical protein
MAVRFAVQGDGILVTASRRLSEAAVNARHDALS